MEHFTAGIPSGYTGDSHSINPTETGAKGGHWKGTVSHAESDVIAFDITPKNEVDNIEVELLVDGVACVAEIELTSLNPDGTFKLDATPEANGIQGSFDSNTSASGTVTLHNCGGNPVPPTSSGDVYEWSAQWISAEVGFMAPFNIS